MSTTLHFSRWRRQAARLASLALVATAVPLTGALASPASSAGTGPGYTLEGCRNDGTITFPANGPYVCADARYTAGNLFDWAELDLVPHRLTLAKPGATDVTLNLGGDHQYSTSQPYLGWDFVSEPRLNTAKSGTGCPTATTVQINNKDLSLVPGSNGGAYDSIQRAVRFQSSGAASANCVYDYYQRLALGSSNYSGSSLQSYVNSTYSGEKRIQLPVPVRAQVLTKDMSATQDSDYAWNVTKEATPASLTFANTCTSTTGSSGGVQIKVAWTRLAATPGVITAITNIYANNPSGRYLDVSVVDKIYSGTTLLQTQPALTKILPPNSTVLVGTETVTLPAGTTDINDIATATYSDLVTGAAIPQTTQARASAAVGTGTTTNATATVTDTESITGSGLTFSVAQPSVGSFTGYTAGTKTTGPVLWSSGPVSGDGSVTFDKTVYADYATSTDSGSLSDTATVTTSGGVTYQASAAVSITSTTLGSIAVTKTIPNVLSGSETATFLLKVASGTVYDPANVVGTLTYTFTAGQTTQTKSVTGLPAGSYVVHEEPATGWLTPDDAVVPLSGSTVCGSGVTFVNQPVLSNAVAKKVTAPAGFQQGWSFTLTRPDGSTLPGVTDANGDIDFGVLANEGTYSITETLQSGWGQKSTSGCSFTVNYPADAGKIYSCVINNQKLGKLQLTKLYNGGAIPTGMSFTFDLRRGATTAVNGTTLETKTVTTSAPVTFGTYLVPGDSYQLCETNVAVGWHSTLSDLTGAFVPANPIGEADNSAVCVPFAAAVDQTVTFTVNNTPPPGGDARTIGYWKNWASCTTSSTRKAPVLDRTLAKGETAGTAIGDLVLHGSTSTPDKAPDCVPAVRILSKSRIDNSTKMAKDPAFNMAAQLLAAKLNVLASAGTCTAATDAISGGQALLAVVDFNGITHQSLTSTQAQQANAYATTLDRYNSNRLC